MFSFIKFIFWSLVILFMAYYIAHFLGYQVNTQYFTYSRKECENKLKSCSNDLIHKGIDNAKCNFQCVDPHLIIKKH
jgi:hypothetical protein